MGSSIPVKGTLAIPTSPHARNLDYFRTKERSLGHVHPVGVLVGGDVGPAIDPSELMGTVSPKADRPLRCPQVRADIGRSHRYPDGRRSLDQRRGRTPRFARPPSWLRRVLVGIGTVLLDDPRPTIRMVPGASPLRVVLDPTLRVPLDAKILDADAPTLIVTTHRSSPHLTRTLSERHVRVRLVAAGRGGVDVAAALAALRDEGVASLLVEGGAKVITSLLEAGMVDRIVVGVAPRIIGAGTDAVGPLGVARVADGIGLENRSVHMMADDVLLAWDVERGNRRNCGAG